MIQFSNVLIANGVLEEAFVCDLERCKGACCVEGDVGAPLEEDELARIKSVIPQVKPYLNAAAIQVLENKGGYEKDADGDYVTTTVDGKECAFAFYDSSGTLKCGIEQAHLDGHTSFKKPISCHLYPIRVGKTVTHETLNYDQWDICSPACALGRSLSVKVYEFLKEALERKYGREWYTAFSEMAQSYLAKKNDGDEIA